jgi:hypothetical protein
MFQSVECHHQGETPKFCVIKILMKPLLCKNIGKSDITQLLVIVNKMYQNNMFDIKFIKIFRQILLQSWFVRCLCG